MAKNNKNIFFLIAIIAIVIGFFLFADTDKPTIVPASTLDLEISDFPSPAEIAVPTVSLEKSEIIKVDKFLKSTLFSIIQPFGLLATVADPAGSGDWCFDESCTCQCTGDFSFCDNWLNVLSPCAPPEQEEIIETCPSGFILVGSGKCCPNDFPHHCSTNNLCYAESNCGIGSADNIICHQRLESIHLDKKSIFKTCAPISQCIHGGSEGAGSCGNYGYDVGDDPNWAYCNQPIWVGANSPPEIQQLGISGECDSCAGEITRLSDHESIGTLCQINDQCQLEEITCKDTRFFKSCQEISHYLYVSPFKAFSATTQSCPSGTICNVNRCEADSDGDGFPDSIDQCPNVGTIGKINQFGCPLVCEENQVTLSGGCVDLSVILAELALNLSILESDLAQKILLIQDLNLNLAQQGTIISNLELSSQEQGQLITDLTSNIDEQAVIISNLDIAIQEQASTINNMQLTVAQQAQLIDELDLSIQDQLVIIDNLNINLQTKINLVNQLEITNEEQQQLISQMQGSFSEQADIITSLELTITEDAQFINDLQLSTEAQAGIINNLELSIQNITLLVNKLELEKDQVKSLVSQLELTVDEQLKLIDGLNLNLDEKIDLVKELNITVSEQNEIINKLKEVIPAEVPSDKEKTEIPQIVIIIFILGGIFLVLRLLKFL